MSAFNSVRQIVILSLTGFVAYFSFSTEIGLFAWHPPLMLIGFLFLMTEAILAFSSDHALTMKLTNKNRLDVHGALQFGAGIFIALGFLSIYYSNIQRDEEEPSFHSNVGYVACILSAGAFCGGVLAKFGGKLKLPISLMKIVHAFFGTLTYYLALNAICSGLNSAWLLSHVAQNTIFGLMGVVIVIGMTTMHRPIRSVYARINVLLSKNK